MLLSKETRRNGMLEAAVRPQWIHTDFNLLMDNRNFSVCVPHLILLE